VLEHIVSGNPEVDSTDTGLNGRVGRIEDHSKVTFKILLFILMLLISSVAKQWIDRPSFQSSVGDTRSVTTDTRSTSTDTRSQYGEKK